MGKRNVRINPHEFLGDLRDGWDDSHLIAKHGLNKVSLDQLFQRLIAKGLITAEELEARRARLHPNSTGDGWSACAQDDPSSVQTEKGALGQKRSLTEKTLSRWDNLSTWKKILLRLIFGVAYDIFLVFLLLISPMIFLIFLIVSVFRYEKISVRDEMRRVMEWIKAKTRNAGTGC